MAKELTAGSGNSNSQDRWDSQARPETPAQRWSRTYAEILLEVRGAQIGTQLLLVFLLTLAFTSRFGETTQFQRTIYVVGLVLGAAANCLLIAPAPFHRLVFRRRLEAQFVRASSRFALWGVTLLMLALNATLLLILDVVMGHGPAIWITVGTLLWFLTWWYAAPAWHRIGQKRRRKAATIAALEVASEKLRRTDERVALGAERRQPLAHAPEFHPAQELRSGPEARLPLMPTPYHPELTSAHQLGYPAGVLPATSDRPSPRPGAATGPYRAAPQGPVPVGYGTGSIPHGTGPIPRGNGPIPYNSGPIPHRPEPIHFDSGPIPPIPPVVRPTPQGTSSHRGATGSYAVVTGSHPVVPSPQRPVPYDTNGPKDAEKSGQTVAFQGAAAAGPGSLIAAALAAGDGVQQGPRGRHHADSSAGTRLDQLGLPSQRSEGSGGMQHGRSGFAPQQGEGSGGMQHGRSGLAPEQGEGSGGMQHGRSGFALQRGEGSGGMQHGRVETPPQQGEGSGGMQHGHAVGGPPQGLVLPGGSPRRPPVHNRNIPASGNRLSAAGREAGSALGPNIGPGWLSAPTSFQESASSFLAAASSSFQESGSGAFREVGSPFPPEPEASAAPPGGPASGPSGEAGAAPQPAPAAQEPAAAPTAPPPATPMKPAPGSPEPQNPEPLSIDPHPVSIDSDSEEEDEPIEDVPDDPRPTGYPKPFREPGGEPPSDGPDAAVISTTGSYSIVGRARVVAPENAPARTPRETPSGYPTSYPEGVV